MSLLHTFRTSRQFARAALLWWCLALGLAAAAPLAQAQGSRMVCTASGMVMLVDADSGVPVGQGTHAMDCALCMVAGAPPSAPPSLDLFVSAGETLLAQPLVSTPAWRSAAPPPGRGPPALA
jgi:hypothetical protein